MRNAINIALIFCCAATAVAREESRRDFQKNATLAAGRPFRIEHSLGNITVRTHASNDVSIHAVIRCSADRADRAKECADRVQISVQENASGVSVRTEYPRYEGRSNISYGAEYDITVPDRAPLDIRNRFGVVSVAGVQAPVTINNGNGRVSLVQGSGTQRIENSFGEVEVAGNNGDVTVVNANGDVTARDITGALDISDRFGKIEATSIGRNLTVHSGNGSVTVLHVGGIANIANSFGGVSVTDAKADVIVRNENGNVDVTGAGGSADLHTTFGNLKFTRIGRNLTVHAANAPVTGDTVGESATVETSFGTVTLSGVKGGARVTAGNSAVRLTDVGGASYVKTSFGGVTAEDMKGALTVENSNGSVVVQSTASKCQPLILGTTFAPIKVTLASGVGYNVAARTSFGRVRSEPELTVSGDLGPAMATGKIGGGGCDLKLTNSNGDIQILKGGAK